MITWLLMNLREANGSFVVIAAIIFTIGMDNNGRQQ